MSYWTELRTPTERELIVGMYDLTQYTLYSLRTPELRTLEVMTGYHALAAKIIENMGGIFIKPIGDAGLFAFPIEQADDAIIAVECFLDQGDAWLAAEDYPGRARVVLDAGLVAIGRMGAQGREWLDIIGTTVNVVGSMQSFRLTMTPAMFRTLSPETRKRFKKHTPPVSYIAEKDPRPLSYWRGYERGATP